MVRVLVFGATGFIGNSVCQALRRNGHIVYGVVRSEAKALELSKQEVTPILAEISETAAWLPILDQVDIVIDSSPSYGGISEGILKALKESPRVTKAEKFHPKLGFIYISGVWVHGASEETTTDRIPVGLDSTRSVPGIVAWRPALENSILESRDVLDVTILRPGLVFGGSGSLCAYWWGPIVEALKKQQPSESVTIPGIAEATIPLSHKDDIAEAVLNTTEKFETVSQISYPVFSLVSGHETLKDINNAAARVLGYTGELKYQKSDDYLASAASTSIRIDTTRSRNYLGWEPKHTSLINQADVYVKAYLFTTDYYSAK